MHLHRITPSIVISIVAVAVSAGAVFFAYSAWQGTRENFGFQLHRAATQLDVRTQERVVALQTSWVLYVTNLSAVEATLIRCGHAGDFFPDFGARECELHDPEAGDAPAFTLLERPLDFRPGETKRLTVGADLFLTNVGIAFDDYFDVSDRHPSLPDFLRETERDIFRNVFSVGCVEEPDGVAADCAVPEDESALRNPVIGFVVESGRGNRFVFSQRYFQTPSAPGAY